MLFEVYHGVSYQNTYSGRHRKPPYCLLLSSPLSLLSRLLNCALGEIRKNFPQSLPRISVQVSFYILSVRSCLLLWESPTDALRRWPWESLPALLLVVHKAAYAVLPQALSDRLQLRSLRTSQW